MNCDSLMMKLNQLILISLRSFNVNILYSPVLHYTNDNDLSGRSATSDMCPSAMGSISIGDNFVW